MPTVLKLNGFRFFFYSNDHLPVHIHVEKGNSTAKFNLQPIELIKSKGFKARDLSEIRKLIEKNKTSLENSWYEYHGYQ
jgi:hypothetical protein